MDAQELQRLKELAEFWAGKYHSSIPAVRQGWREAWGELETFVCNLAERAVSPAESVQSIDKRKLFNLVEDLLIKHQGRSQSEYDKCRASLVAYIDAQLVKAWEDGRHSTIYAALGKRVTSLELLVEAYGPKSLQYDIEHPTDGLNSIDPAEVERTMRGASDNLQQASKLQPYLDASQELDAATDNFYGQQASTAQEPQHDSDCSIHNAGVPELLGPCDCSLSAQATTEGADLFDARQQFLDWNRSLAKERKPIVSIGAEYAVFDKAMEFARAALAATTTAEPVYQIRDEYEGWDDVDKNTFYLRKDPIEKRILYCAAPPQQVKP